jgi:hypothetical protein
MNDTGLGMVTTQQAWGVFQRSFWKPNSAWSPASLGRLKVLPDPRIKASLADWQEQARVALQIRDRFSEANEAVKEIRRVKAELADRQAKMPAAQQSAYAAMSSTFNTALSQVEDSLYQTKNRSGQDPLNYPIRLNNRIGALMGVVSSSDGRPTQQTYDVYKVLQTELNKDLSDLRKVMADNLPKINAMLRAAGLKPIDAAGPIS